MLHSEAHPPAARPALEIVPTIMAGERGGPFGDSPGARVDPNTADSRFAGVGSLALRFRDGLFGCSGAAIGPRHVLTAAHCLFDGPTLLAPENVTFVLNAGGDRTHMIRAAALHVHPGFAPRFDLRFDLAVLALAEDLPEHVPVYGLLRQPLPLRTVVTFVGYGHSGDGHAGIDPDIGIRLEVKRTGRNVVDFIGGPGRPNENLFFYDFDAPQAWGLNVLGGLSLGNQVETAGAFGDSGGPVFVDAADGSPLVAAVNNFGVHFRAAAFQRFSTFGEGGGGVVVPPHLAWIEGVLGLAPPVVSASFVQDTSDDSAALFTEVESNFDLYYY
ncbi:MAG TPA: trypsin-like serine protease, partial [Vicinamibacteria bacterium]|nr:trypsin-like serine protease [Vicinamibacteria bacterium]